MTHAAELNRKRRAVAENCLTETDVREILEIAENIQSQPARKRHIIVKRSSILSDPRCAFEATLHEGSGGYGRYGATAEEAEAKLRQDKDCEGVESEFIDEPQYRLTSEKIPGGGYRWVTKGNPLVWNESTQSYDDSAEGAAKILAGANPVDAEPIDMETAGL